MRHSGPPDSSPREAGSRPAWNPLRSPWMTGVSIGLWAGIALIGFVVLLAFDKSPGRAAAAPTDWPAASRLPREPGEPLLVMLVQPAGVSRAWTATQVTGSAVSMRGVTVIADSAGVETARFGSWTSGQVLLYDATGRLRFSGGITGARGHPGDNAGLSALTAADHALDVATPAAGASVYGCPLRGPERGTFSFLGDRP